MKTNKPSLKEIFRYYYNTIFTKGTAFKVVLLFLVSLLFIFALGICLNISVGGSLIKNSWVTLLHLLDPGVISDDNAPGLYLVIMLIATLGGMILFGTLIGIINEGINSRLSDINSVNYKIIENDHIIIIGFNAETFYILKELVDFNLEIKNAGEKTHPIVILDDTHSAEEMSALVESSLGKHPGTRIIYRVGQSLNPKILDICNVYQAKSIIINTGDDYQTLKWIINISNLLGKSHKPVITTIIKDLKNVLAAEYASGDNVNILFSDDIITHVLSLSCNNSGISTVIEDIIDFHGTQLVVYKNQLFTGNKLSDINLTLKNATIIGLYNTDGKVTLMSEIMDKTVSTGDNLLLLADNEYEIEKELKGLTPKSFSSNIDFITKGNEDVIDSIEVPQTVLILRFSRTIEALVEDQLSTLPAGSKIVVACSPEYDKYIKLLQIGYNDQGLEIVKLKGISYYSLKSLLDNYNPCKVIILSDYMEPSASLTEESDTVFKDVEKEDEEVLLAALFLKAIAERKGLKIDIVAELQKSSSKALVSNMIDSCDFINVGQLTSHILTQAVNDPRVFNSLKSLFSETHYKMRLYDASKLIKADGTTEYDIRNIISLLNLQRKTFLGISKDSITLLNPSKSQKYTFSSNDKFIVIEAK